MDAPFHIDNTKHAIEGWKPMFSWDQLLSSKPAIPVPM